MGEGVPEAPLSSEEGEVAAASPVERGVSAAPRRRGAANDAGCARGGRRPTSPTLQESATARAATPPRAIKGEAMRARTARALATSSRGARAGAEQLTAAIRSGRIHAQVDKKKGAKSKRKRFFFFWNRLYPNQTVN